MQPLNVVANEATHASARDGLEDLIQRVLLSYEGLIPDRRSTLVIDDFESPSLVPLDPVDQDFQGRPLPSDLTAEAGADDVVVVHLGTPLRAGDAIICSEAV